MFSVFISVIVSGFAGLVASEIIEGELAGLAVFSAVFGVSITLLNSLTSKRTNRPPAIEQSGFPWIRTILGTIVLGAPTLF